MKENTTKFEKLIAKAFDVEAPPMPNFQASERKAPIFNAPQKPIELDYQQLDMLAAAKQEEFFANKNRDKK